VPTAALRLSRRMPAAMIALFHDDYLQTKSAFLRRPFTRIGSNLCISNRIGSV
jgi:hypothetical protein